MFITNIISLFILLRMALYMTYIYIHDRTNQVLPSGGVLLQILLGSQTPWTLVEQVLGQYPQFMQSSHS